MLIAHAKFHNPTINPFWEKSNPWRIPGRARLNSWKSVVIFPEERGYIAGKISDNSGHLVPCSACKPLGGENT
jgi:hypothetical protein